MKRGYIIVGLGIFLFLFIASAYATSEEPNTLGPGTIKVTLQPGWNIISLPAEGRISTSGCGEELYAYVFVQDVGGYLSIGDAEDYLGEDGLYDYLAMHSFWVYSFGKCDMVLDYTSLITMGEIRLESGWNFVPITGDMIGDPIRDIQGNCTIESAYIWDSESQDWSRLEQNSGFSEMDTGRGFIAKVGEACNLGSMREPLAYSLLG